jgi:hypothetical protein
MLHVQKDCQKPRIICYGCGKDGHTKPECPNKASWSGHNLGGGPAGQNTPFEDTFANPERTSVVC